MKTALTEMRRLGLWSDDLAKLSGYRPFATKAEAKPCVGKSIGAYGGFRQDRVLKVHNDGMTVGLWSPYGRDIPVVESFDDMLRNYHFTDSGLPVGVPLDDGKEQERLDQLGRLVCLKCGHSRKANGELNCFMGSCKEEAK